MIISLFSYVCYLFFSCVNLSFFFFCSFVYVFFSFVLFFFLCLVLSLLFIFFFFLMFRRPPRSTRIDTLFPSPTLFRSLTRDLAERFNARYGETFTVPMPVIQRDTARIFDLQNPTAKMSKSAESDAGVLWMLDEPSVTAKKIMRAVTDSRSEEHTSELQSLMRISYAVFCLKKKKKQ